LAQLQGEGCCRVLTSCLQDLAVRFGDVVGGLINATFGNVVEVMVSMFALFKAGRRSCGAPSGLHGCMDSAAATRTILPLPTLLRAAAGPEHGGGGIAAGLHPVQPLACDGCVRTPGLTQRRSSTAASAAAPLSGSPSAPRPCKNGNPLGAQAAASSSADCTTACRPSPRCPTALARRCSCGSGSSPTRAVTWAVGHVQQPPPSHPHPDSQHLALLHALRPLTLPGSCGPQACVHRYLHSLGRFHVPGGRPHGACRLGAGRVARHRDHYVVYLWSIPGILAEGVVRPHTCTRQRQPPAPPQPSCTATGTAVFMQT
jgi:hypothetical protein